MAGIWTRLKSSRQKNYNVEKLIDQRVLNTVFAKECRNHIICDIDKTYLETEFESFMKMARIAFEDASDKITVEGASEVLRAARWGDSQQRFEREGKMYGPNTSLHFVSSSPPQLRSVLEEKLWLDHVDWDSDTFKNQMYNLRKARVDLLRNHTTYKSLGILKILSKLEDQSNVYLIGDSAESDALIYLGVKCFVEKIFSKEDYLAYLIASGVDQDATQEIFEILPKVKDIAVRGIFIRGLISKSMTVAPPFTDVVSVFKNFFELALYFLNAGLIPPQNLWSMGRMFCNNYGLSRKRLVHYLRLVVGENSLPQGLSAQAQECLRRLDESEEAVKVFKTAKDFGFRSLNACKNSKDIWSDRAEMLESAMTFCSEHRTHIKDK